jgi:hypothetical protein
MILENINWPEILTSSSPMARLVRFAESWAEKVEAKLASGMAWTSAIENGLIDAKLTCEAISREEIMHFERMAAGLLYACWRRGDKFKEYWLTRKGQDLSQHSLLERPWAKESGLPGLSTALEERLPE